MADDRGSVPEQSVERIPPQDLDAEQATLGAMLLELGAAARAMSIVEEDDFYRDAHRTIFRAALDVQNRNEPVDLVTIVAELRRMGKLEAVGGGQYLTALINEVPTSAHVARYASIVAEKAVLRKLIQAGGDIQSVAYSNPADIGVALDRAEQAIFEIAQRRTSSDFAHIGPIVTDTFDKLEAVFHTPGFVTGVPTGLADLDKMTSGLQRGDLVIVAGRPSMGKTSLAISNFALHAATKHDVGVGIFSLEMSSAQLAEMLLCAEAQVNSYNIRRGMANERDWGAIGQALTHLPTAPIYIDDTPGLPILELRSKARRLKAQHDIGLIVIDYLQLITTGQRGQAENRHQEVSTIARALKGIARELDVPVVALSQLSRRVEQREDKRPILSDLAESGSIEADADLVCFLYRNSYYKRREMLEEARKKGQDISRDEMAFDKPDEAEIIIAKHRNGPVGDVPAMFHPVYRTFHNVDRFRES